MFRPQVKPSTKRKICPECRGTGKVMKNDVWSWGWKPCEPCKGTGYVEYAAPSFTPRPMQQRNPLNFRRP